MCGELCRTSKAECNAQACMTALLSCNPPPVALNGSFLHDALAHGSQDALIPSGRMPNCWQTTYVATQLMSKCLDVHNHQNVLADLVTGMTLHRKLR